ncbi:hypothetical protein MKL09_26800 [Methylobacterium sp. J-048]|uniref:hypothetical protein n=1 Tax=Methylobacterium sp. J-048 TaxID=2836635 RepID=UPI001FBA4827|nr:hypothetical protein [Methylobacterium sp. J-048]MCJ2060127.1 hypothetical protein [Methylobacterium sp. J-048]
MTASTRRAALGAILAAPLTGGAVMALPLGAVAAPSDLAQACDWAIHHRAWINHGSDAEDWDDDRIGFESDRHEAVVVRAASEPSRSPADLAAKARLLLDEWASTGLLKSTYGDERLAATILQEVIKLCA